MPFSHLIHTYLDTALRHTHQPMHPHHLTDATNAPTTHTSVCVALQSAKSTPQPSPLLRLDGASGKLAATCAPRHTHGRCKHYRPPHVAVSHRQRTHVGRRSAREKQKESTPAHAPHPRTPATAQTSQPEGKMPFSHLIHVSRHSPTTTINQRIHIT